MPDLFSSVETDAIPKPQLFSHVLKRDGRKVPFDAQKITAAITAAGHVTGEVDRRTARRLTARVIQLAWQLGDVPAGESTKEPSVEAIQDLVEEVLLASPYKRTAKAYILYRDQHTQLRELTARADINMVDLYLERRDWRVSENSNMAFSLQGLNNYISSEVSKVYWLNRIYPPEVRRAHLEGDFHIHDLNLLSVYCVGWDLRELLLRGFRGAPGKAESRPARHFRTALGQVVNFFYTLQGEAAGAQAFSSFDTLLAPFIRHDGLGYQEVKQALQEFVFNINVPTRVGFQTPFTNLTLDLRVSPLYADEPAVVGGEFLETTYAEYQPEVTLLNRALFEVLCEGDAAGRVFTFPIPTVNVGPDFPWDDPDLEPMWRATARYGIPYFANFVNSDLSPEDARSMCCRLRLDLRKLESRGGGLFGANPLTGSIGVVTINMPRLGHLARDEEDLLRRLERVMALARDSLEIKRKVLERFTDRDLYPYTKYFLRDIRRRYGSYWHNHFSTIGLVGFNEACLNLLGVGVGDEAGRRLAERTLDFMRDRLAEYQQQTGHLYNLEATPAEGAAYRLARLDRRRHPNLRTDAPFYNNSTQLPVDFSDDVFEVLDLQDGIQTRYTGGTVLHVFSGEAQADPESVKAFARTVCSRYRLPYFTFTPTFSVCPEHGYMSGEHERCPRCDEPCEVYSRVVGYLRPVSQWNEGKVEEFRHRASFKICADRES
jgi:ribonucleoside-triphosphate reductase